VGHDFAPEMRRAAALQGERTQRSGPGHTQAPHRYAIRRSLTACLGQFGIVKASSPSIQLVRVYRCSV
jgi:hypothetical protein